MEYVNKNYFVIFGYSEILTLALFDNSKLNKVKEFNILEDNNEDKFFTKISSFISKKSSFKNVFYSCGPGSFTMIRRIISYVKALKFINNSNTKFIGFNNLFIIACYFNYKYKINNEEYILAILNHSKDNFVQIYQKKKKSCFFVDSLSDIQNMDLDVVETYLGTLNLSIQNVHSIYLGPNPNNVSFLNNIQLVDRSNILEIIIKISDLIENDQTKEKDYEKFFLEKFDPLYGKLPSTN